MQTVMVLGGRAFVEVERNEAENRVVVKNIDQNIIKTTSLLFSDEQKLQPGEKGYGLRYDDGTQLQLSWAMRRTWAFAPTSERIVEDVMRYPLVIDKIVLCSSSTRAELCHISACSMLAAASGGGKLLSNLESSCHLPRWKRSRKRGAGLCAQRLVAC